MDINKMRNIVILKDLPSNVVEEAFVVLKKNQKIRNVEYADYGDDKFSDDIERDYESQFVVKEAELLISNYISRTEDEHKNDVKGDSKLRKKYKIMKGLVGVLGALLIGCCCCIF